MVANDKSIFTIGAAAGMLNVSPRTLRSYEEQGLVKPLRNGKWRYYSMDNIKWLSCVRHMMVEHDISITAVKKLLRFTPCWDISGCSYEDRKLCSAFMSSALMPKQRSTAQQQPYRQPSCPPDAA